MPAFQRATPSSQGVDARAVLDFLDGVEAADIELHSLMLLRGSAVIAEATWAPYEPGRLNLLYSLSKSVVSTAAGLAIEEGRFGLDDRVVDLMPHLVPADVDERWTLITVRHCLTMATGHLQDPPRPAHGTDMLAAFLRLPPEADPGTVFTYNQMATHTVARIVAHTTGQRLLDYLRPRLLDPLGIEDAAWFTDGLGHDLGFSGLHLPTDAVARFGQLLLQEGRWEDRQLVPAEWIAQATSYQMDNDDSGDPPGRPREEVSDWDLGYGFQFWMCREGYRGDGAYGQFCLVLPDRDAVLVLTAEHEAMQDMLDQVWTHLLPGFDRPGSAEADEELRDRLAAAHLDGPGDDASGTATDELRREGGNAAPGVTSVRLERGDTADVLVFGSPEGTWRLPVGRGRWERGLWRDDPGTPFCSWGGRHESRYVAHLRMIRTPHTMVLTADPASGVVRLDWSEAPLHGPAPEAHSLTAT